MQCLKDWARDHVLSEHFDCVPFRNALVQVIAQLLQEFLEDLPGGLVCRHHGLDPDDVPLRYNCHITGPFVPVAPVSTLFNNLGPYCGRQVVV